MPPHPWAGLQTLPLEEVGVTATDATPVPPTVVATAEIVSKTVWLGPGLPFSVRLAQSM